MNAEIRPGTLVGEGMQILHAEREGNEIVLAMWGGEVVEADVDGAAHDRPDYFGTLRLHFSDEDLASAAFAILHDWQESDKRLLLRCERGRYASVTDPESGLRVAAGPVP